MRRFGMRVLPGVLAALLGGAALAQQKPEPLGDAPAPPGKFGPPAAAVPAPALPRAPPPAAPAVRDDKFSGPPAAATPPTATPPAAGKFSPGPAAPGAAPNALVPPRAPPPGAAPPPAGEPAPVGQLRTLLGPDATLTYGAVQLIDPAGGAVRLTAVVIERPGRRATIEELTLGGLRDDGVAEADARGVVLQDQDCRSTVARLRLAGVSVRRPAPGEEFQPDMLTTDTIRIEGLEVRAAATTVAIAELAVEDYGSGRTGRLTLAGLDVRVLQAGMVDRVRLARVGLRGIDLAASLAALARRTTPPRPPGSYELEVAGVALAGGDRALGSLDTLRLSGEAGGAAESGSLALRALRVEPFPGLAQWLQRFGYPALVADLTAESRYDRAAGRVELTSLSIAGREIGAIGLSLVMDGVTAEAAEAQDMQAMRLVSFALRYVDQSLYGRFVRLQAREGRIAEAEVRNQHAALVAGALGGSGAAGRSGLAPVRDAIIRFIRGQAREVEITARPPRPLAFSDLAAAGPDPEAAQRLLGLGATAR